MKSNSFLPRKGWKFFLHIDSRNQWDKYFLNIAFTGSYLSIADHAVVEIECRPVVVFGFRSYSDFESFQEMVARFGTSGDTLLYYATREGTEYKQVPADFFQTSPPLSAGWSPQRIPMPPHFRVEREKPFIPRIMLPSVA